MFTSAVTTAKFCKQYMTTQDCSYHFLLFKYSIIYALIITRTMFGFILVTHSMCSTTAVIIGEDNERTYLIFKLAYKLALDGLKCLIITKPIARSSFGKILNERQWLSPDVLELIQFRQFKSATCLIDWCHCFLNGQAMPHAILLNGFEDFCDVTEFLAYYLCACLIDTAKHLTKCLSEKNINFHLILAFKSSTYNNRPAFFDMFRNILSAEEVVKQFNVNTH